MINSCRKLVAGLVVALVVGPAASADDWTSVYYAQMKLRSLGYEIEPDGRTGPATRKALAEAGEKHGFNLTVTELFRHFAVETVRHRKPVEDPAQMAAIEESVKHDLMDPFTSHLREVYLHNSGMACGEVNAKNQFGAYVGWRTFMIPLMIPLKDQSGKWYAVGALIDGPDQEFSNISCMLDIAIRLSPEDQREIEEHARSVGASE